MTKRLIMMTCEEYANTFAKLGEFQRRKQHFYLYLSCGSRLAVFPETHPEHGFGYDRREECAEQLINSDELDAQEFADQFVQHVGELLTLRDLDVLITTVTKYRDDWEARRQAFMRESSK